MLNEATKANLRRKSAYVDVVQMHQGKPMFSWVDLSLTELCNRSAGHPRACVFCPRIDPTFYPNQPNHMSMDLVRKLVNEMTEIKFRGTVVLCGFGEPLLHPQIDKVVATLKGCSARVEIVTNGDRLNKKTLPELIEAGVDYIVVSMYDGEHQREPLQKLFAENNFDGYLLRDRWHSEADGFGLKLTNRAGTVGVGLQDPIDTNRPCHYLAYQLTVDWNGDVLLCVQDWHKKLKYGNLNYQSMWDVWTSSAMHKRRIKLIAAKRDDHPCSSCNTDGTLHGFAHVPAWGQS